MTAATIRLGTRGSALALAQARLVESALGAVRVEGIEIVTIETAGDRRRPDTAWGEGAFVAEIERALLDGRVDAAVHSAKDVPTRETPGLVIAAYVRREDPRDALVVRAGVPARTLSALPAGARVGTDSPRRTGFVLAHRPDLRVHPLHGNVETRLRRLDAGEADALILAVAGLARLGRTDRIGEVLEPSLVPPAPGQGAIAVQVRLDDPATPRAVAAIDHRETRLAVEAERAFLAASGGGCRAPIGALATVEDGDLIILGAYSRPDGSAVARDRVRGPAGDGPRLGAALAARLGERLPGIASEVEATGSEATPGGRRRLPKVVVTRAADGAVELMRHLRTAGIEPIAVPAIGVEPASPGGELDRLVRRIDAYDWVVVTSANGARSLLAAVERVGARLEGPHWAAVGSATAATLAERGVPVDHRPERASGRGLGAELPVEPGERVLLARGDLATSQLPDELRARGAIVEEAIAYRTVEAPPSSRSLLREALEDGPVQAVLFTSGSTVRGLVALADVETLPGIRSIPAICIGPETAAEARRAGFEVLAEAPVQDAAAFAATTAKALEAQIGETR